MWSLKLSHMFIREPYNERATMRLIASKTKITILFLTNEVPKIANGNPRVA